MNHDEIIAMMAAYVDDELPGSERKLVEGHVAGCASCRAELAAMTALQRQVRKTLHQRAEMVEAPAESWAALQARVAAEPAPALAGALTTSNNHRGVRAEGSRPSWLLRGLSLGFAGIAALVFVWLVIISPMLGGNAVGGPSEKKKTPTPTLVGEPITPGPDAATPVPTVAALSFISLSPTRLPEGAAYMDDAVQKDGSRLLTFYNKKGDNFLTVTQRAAAPDEALPDGAPTMVGNLPGVILSGLSGRVDAGDRKISYKDASGLVWITPFGTRVSIVSNLPDPSVTFFAEGMAVTFRHYGSSAIPDVDQWASNGLEGIDGGLLLGENHMYGETHFINVTQSAGIGQELPEGETVTLPNGIEATIVRGLSGRAPALAHEFFPGRNIAVLGGGGGGGGGGGPDYVEPVYTDYIDYTDGIRLVWMQEGTLIDVLTNVSEDDALAYAAGMEPAPAMSGALVTGAFVDASVLPHGGAMAGYVIAAPELPQEFYYHTQVSVSEGDGTIMEYRYFGNDVFVVITTRRDDGGPLPAGDAATVSGHDATVQGGQSGRALLKISDGGWVTTLQDGIPRLFLGLNMGNLGEKDPSQTDLTYPDTIDYQDGKLVTWAMDGARLTLLTNLSTDQALEIADKIIILGKDYTIIQPNSQNMMGQLFTDGYDLWGPTYMPESIRRIAPADPDRGTAPESLFWNEADPSQFVIIKQRAAGAGEIVNTPLSRVMLGQPVLIRQISGSYEFRYAGEPRTIVYENAVEITVIVDGTWIQIITSLPMEEANKIGEGMVKGK